MLEEMKGAIRDAAAHAEAEKFVPNELIVPALLLETSDRLTALSHFVQQFVVPTRVKLQEDRHASIMVGFWLDPKTARRLAIPGGEAPDELHITLCYLGRVDEFTADIEHLKATVAKFAADSIPLGGSIGGIGRFTPSESSDNLSPIIALVNVPKLQEKRRLLAEMLDNAGVYIANDFDFLPHITLAYINPGAPMPISPVEPLPLTFDTLWLCIGDERIPFRLGGPAETGPKHWTEAATPATMGDPLDWSDDDLDKLSQITDNDLTNAVQLWNDNAPDEFRGMLNAEVEQ